MSKSLSLSRSSIVEGQQPRSNIRWLTPNFWTTQQRGCWQRQQQPP
jgi:hypothetical protein